jgi:uncharacterized RDD family membrane protein YckC
LIGDTRVIWRRGAAHALDGVLPVGLGLAVAAAVGDEFEAVFLTVCTALMLLEWIVLQGATGWSPGKWLTGIRVVNEHGDPPGIVAAVKRTAPLFLEWTALFALYVILTDPQAQRLGDRWARTYVIRAPRRAPAFEGVGVPA